MNTKRQLPTVIALVLFLLIAAQPSISSPDICIASPDLKVSVVHGRVVNVRKDGEEDPIPNAIVEVTRVRGDEEQTVGTATTDNAGRFHVTNISPGKYKLAASVNSFKTWSATLKVSTGQKRGEIVFRLEPFLPGACGSARVENPRP